MLRKKKQKKSREKEVAKLLASYYKEVYNPENKRRKDREFTVHYQKRTMEVVDEMMKKYDYSLDEIFDMLEINFQKYFHLKTAGRCPATLSKNCLKIVPNQLTVDEQKLLTDLLNHPIYKFLPINHIWAIGQRKKGLMISLYTFYRYTILYRGYIRKPTTHYRIEMMKVRANYPYQKLHMDSTMVKCDDGERVWIHFIMDNFSRKILGAVIDNSTKSMNVAENVIKSIKKYKLENRNIELYCDDGPENRGFVEKLLKQENIKIKKIIANYSTAISNNMIEHFNHKFKSYILDIWKKHSADYLNENIDNMMNFYNNLYMPIHKNCSPNEVADGIRGEDLDMKKQMEIAQKLRREKNSCYDCSLSQTDWDKDFDCPATKNEFD